MAVSSLTTAPEAPSRNDPDNFREEADEYVDWQANTMVPELNTSIGEFNTDFIIFNEKYNDTVQAAQLSQAVANFEGEWDDLTGAATVPFQVYHDGVYWVLLEDIADITAHEPGVSAVWAESEVVITADSKLYYVSKTSAYTVLTTDLAYVIQCSGTFTLSFDPALDLGLGWFCYVHNIGTGNITLDPDGTETIDGVSSGTMEPGDLFLISSDAYNLNCIKLSDKKPHYITSSETWTVPAGIKEIFVQLIGGGGGGGYATTATYSGCGGGSGGYTEKTIVVSAGNTKSITIGAAGSGGIASTTTAATAGGTTSFASDCSATGGNGGTTLTGAYPGAFTAGGTGAGGDFNNTGEYGYGVNTSVASLVYNKGGDSKLFKGGGYGLYRPSVGGDAYNYGCGGGGAIPTTTPSNLNGGDGYQGICIIWY